MRLERIFEQQEKLYHSFAPVVLNNGLPHASLPCDLDDPQVQAQIKLTLYAFLEELGEAAEAAIEGADLESVLTEYVDAFHFLVEIFLLCGIGPDELVPESLQFAPGTRAPVDLLDALFSYAEVLFPTGSDALPSSILLRTQLFATKLGYVLKNKPWKQSRRKTDLQQLKKAAQELNFSFLQLIIIAGMSPQDLYDRYLSKHKINEERIRSGY